MTKAEIIEYLYDNNVRADITIEQMADDLTDHKTKPQIYDFFRNPTVEERKAVADYIDSISVPTGVNVFDLMDEPQTDCPESCPSRDICTKSDTDCIWRKGGI